MKKYSKLLLITLAFATMLLGCQSNEINALAAPTISETSNSIKETPISEIETSSNETISIMPSEKTEPMEVSTIKETTTVHTHNHSSAITKEATCTEEGIKTYTCDCGDTYTETVSKLEHISSDWIVLNEATCTLEGSKHKVCTLCNEEMETATIEKNEHTSSEWLLMKMATCTEKGLEVKKCTVCDKELDSRSIEKTNHTINDWELVLEATCETEGLKTQSCSICGIELNREAVSALGHSVSDWIVLTETTCLSDGVEIKKCMICNVEVDRRIISHLEHQISDWILISEVTCRVDGVKIKKCTLCDLEVDRETIPATGEHIPEYRANPAVCTKCSVCSLVLRNHIFTSYVSKEPTLDSVGYRRYECECGYKYREIIPKLTN